MINTKATIDAATMRQRTRAHLEARCAKRFTMQLCLKVPLPSIAKGLNDRVGGSARLRVSQYEQKPLAKIRLTSSLCSGPPSPSHELSVKLEQHGQDLSLRKRISIAIPMKPEETQSNISPILWPIRCHTEDVVFLVSWDRQDSRCWHFTHLCNIVCRDGCWRSSRIVVTTGIGS